MKNNEELIQEVFSEYFDTQELGFSTSKEDIKKFMYKQILQTACETGSVSMKIKGFQSLFREAFGEEFMSSPKEIQGEKEEEEEVSLPFDLNIQKERM